jgi:hypothetical protein
MVKKFARSNLCALQLIELQECVRHYPLPCVGVNRMADQAHCIAILSLRLIIMYFFVNNSAYFMGVQ